MGTNKTLLVKGVRYLAYAIPLMFIGPTIIHSSFKNQEHPFYIPILGIGIIFCIGSGLLMFKGIQTMTNSLFDGNSPD